MDLTGASVQELQDEIYRRKLKEKRLQSECPKILDEIDWTSLVKLCRDYVEHIVGEVTEQEYYCSDGDDFEHYIYEEAVQAVFGKDFFEWYNKQVV